MSFPFLIKVKIGKKSFNCIDIYCSAPFFFLLPLCFVKVVRFVDFSVNVHVFKTFIFNKINNRGIQNINTISLF